MSNYRHGVFIEERTTSLLTPVTVDSAMPVIVGVAPVHNLPEGVTRPINEPRLIYSMPEFVAQMGSLNDGENKADYTLYQAAEIYLARYKLAPIVAINVFDPAVHGAEQEMEVPNPDDPENRIIKNVFVPDPKLVTEEDIIGKAATASAARTGIHLVEEVYPRFRLVPGQVLAPKFSADPTVAIAIGAASRIINGHFKSTGICEVPDSVAHYTNAPAWLNDNNIIDPNMLCSFGSYVYGNAVEPGSIHIAAAIGLRDASSEGVPYWSPSNQRLLVEGMVHAGKELHLTPTEAAYLNGNGIICGLNMIGGIVAWGDQTTAYPSNTDVKDNSIPIRRMFTWIGNSLVLSAWSKVSAPIVRRLVETVEDSFNNWLNGLAAREFILGGRVAFEMVDNPTVDLMSGIVRWHVYVTPPQAARELVFILEYDPGYLSTLFGASA